MAFNQFKFIKINSDWCLWQHLSCFEAKVPVLTFRWGPSQARSADVTIGNQLGIYKSRLLREYLAFNRTPEKVPSGVDICWCIKSMDLKNLWYGSFSHIDSKGVKSFHAIILRLDEVIPRYSLLDERLCDLVMAVKCWELGSTGNQRGRLPQKIAACEGWAKLRQISGQTRQGDCANLCFFVKKNPCETVVRRDFETTYCLFLGVSVGYGKFISLPPLLNLQISFSFFGCDFWFSWTQSVGRGYLGGYAWTLMSIHFAQCCSPPLVPSLQAWGKPPLKSMTSELVGSGHGNAGDLGGRQWPWSTIQCRLDYGGGGMLAFRIFRAVFGGRQEVEGMVLV